MTFSFWRRQKRERELDEELQSHLEMARSDRMERGEKEDEARSAALRELGNLGLIKEVTRDKWGWRWLREFMQDLRYGMRVLRKSPGFTLVAVATLALGIGANTAIFSVVNGVLLDPLPYPQPEQVVILGDKTSNFAETWISYPDFLDLARDNHSFSSLAAYESLVSFNLLSQSEPQRVSATEVSSTFFPTLGITPILGRNLLPAEDQLNGPPAVILSGGFWRTKFGGSSEIIGKTINLDGTGYTVVGVLPENFYFCCENISFRLSDVYVPIGADKNPWMRDRKFHPGIFGIGRIKQGVTLIEARSEMDSLARGLAATYPDADKYRSFVVTPLKQDMVQNVRPFLLAVLAAVGFVLLIACVNVANLLFARSAGRAREFAIRAALGAGEGRVIRQLLAESLLLALAGGAVGLGLAAWGLQAGLSVLPSSLPRAGGVRIDPHVLLFTLIVSLFTAVLFGLAPARRTWRPDLYETLKEGGRGASGARYRTQSALVVIEMALTVVLLVGAGLTIRTLVGLWSVNPGFDAHNVLRFNIGFPASIGRADASQIRASLRQLTHKIGAVPGVQSVSLTNAALPMGDRYDLDFWIDGQEKPATDDDKSLALWYLVGSDYLDVMKIPLLRGRFLSAQDDANTPGVCVIDEELARRYFGDQNPVGKRLNFDLVYKQLEIVGVVGHVKQFGLDEGDQSAVHAQIYASPLQLPDDVTGAFVMSYTGYLIRTESSADAFAGAVRDTLREFDSRAVVFQIQTMDDLVAHSLASRRFAMLLLAAFAALALALSSIGIYGVISNIAGRRTHEIGIRVALGANRADVLRLVLGDGMKMILLGVGSGLAAALGLTRLMASLLYGVSAIDPLTFLSVALLLPLVALAACYLPARRAMRVNPIVALRHE